jgi:hypothetical protein
MAYIEGPPARVLLFGGKSGATYLNDTWLWNGATETWAQVLPATSPPARSEHSLVAVNPNAPNPDTTATLFGGTNGATVLGDQWQFTLSADGSSGTWATMSLSPAPPARSGHVAAADQNYVGIYLFGGESNSSFLGDTWLLGSAPAWTDETTLLTQAPSPRFGHAGYFEINRALFFVFGGQVAQGTVASVAGDTWMYSRGGQAWSQVTPDGGTSPAPVYDGAMAFDSRAVRGLLFGGYLASGQAVNTVWELTGGGGAWIQRHPSTLPSARAQHAMAYDAANDRVVLFGGSSNDAETWVWTAAP